VSALWASGSNGSIRPATGAREWVLPTGTTHLAFRLDTEPLRLFAGPGDEHGKTVSCAVIGGPRRSSYLRDVSRPVRSVGAQLRPGAAQTLLGVPAEELRDRHVDAAAVLGAVARELRERLGALESPAAQIAVLEGWLLARVAQAPAPDPLIAWALRQLDSADEVAAIVRLSGFSHRHFASTFRRHVGFSPKSYQGMLRFAAVVAHLHRRPRLSLVDVAGEAGFADQPHFARIFKQIAGFSPGTYRRLAADEPFHVPVKFVQDTRRGESYRGRSNSKGGTDENP